MDPNLYTEFMYIGAAYECDGHPVWARRAAVDP